MRKALFLALAALAAFGCERRDRDRAREESRDLGGEVREGAETVGEKTREFGSEVREGARDIGGEMREGAERFGDRLGAGEGLSADDRAQLEAAAQRDGYQLTFDEDNKITAMKSGARQPVAGQEVSDEELESALKSKLQGQPGGEAFDVDAQAGVVTIKGSFDSADSRSKMIKLALDHPGVQQVIIEHR